MKDLSITLDNEESMKVYAYEGKKIIGLFIWKKDEHHLDIAIEVEGVEKKIIAINHHAQDIEIFDGYSASENE